MGFSNIRTFVDAQETEGEIIVSSFRKSVNFTGVAGFWYDLSQAPGNPPANYYASEPLVAARLNYKNGIWHGADVSPLTKHLSKSMILSATAGMTTQAHLLCDYLLYYPFIDMDSIDPQVLDNTITLPRYTDGKGVKAFLVAQGTYIGGAQYYITYTNERGVSGRISQICTSNTNTLTSTLISSGSSGASARQFGWAIPLQDGDNGIRSVQNIQFLSSNGGIAALVLCYPITTTYLRELAIPVEKDYLTFHPSLPRIYDGAYLNYLVFPAGTMATTVLIGTHNFVWS